MSLRLGVIGLSPGNGHPFSFSAIVNGYDDAGFADAGWDGIHAYLRKRTPGEFGFGDARVTHAWTQDADITERLRRACRIEHAAPSIESMIGVVDAVLLARDDYERHAEMAFPFLEAGIPVFVDKPLTTDRAELERFWPHLVAGRAFSCSGMRFCGELDAFRADPGSLGEVRLVKGVVLNGMAQYGVHMLDAALGARPARPVTVRRVPAPHESVAIEMDDGSLLTIDAMGAVAPVFALSLHGTEGHLSVNLRDNFTAFRRSIGVFLETVRSGTPAIDPADVWASVSTIIAAVSATPGGAGVPVPPPPGR